MTGLSILKALGITFHHFIETYLDDIRWGKKRYGTPEGIEHRRSKDATGIVTIQYPEEKIPVPEEFRFIPFLVYEENEAGEKVTRCTACGICSKVCPPQCIWITRSTDPATGKSIATPAEYYIDIDICMNCGLCAEYCPFDAIKMDHDYEIASYDRSVAHIYNLEKLSKSAAYYASIRPINYAKEQAAKAEKEAAKSAKKPAGGDAPVAG